MSHLDYLDTSDGAGEVEGVHDVLVAVVDVGPGSDQNPRCLIGAALYRDEQWGVHVVVLVGQHLDHSFSTKLL